MMDKKARAVAPIPDACRLRWLLLSALMLPPSLPAVAIQAAVKGIEEGKCPPLLSGELARDALKLCHLAAQSALTGKAVVVK